MTLPLAFTLIPLILGGCATSYPSALNQKLEGKTANERRIVLAQECSAEINQGLKKDDPASVRHFQNMKQICEEMTGQVINKP
jgi:hypothetical protein